jgi:aminopeptidase YwaD
MHSKLNRLIAGLTTGFLSGAGLAWWLARYDPLGQVGYQALQQPVIGEVELPFRIDPTRLRRDTEALSAISVRRSGTPGEIQARNWVRERFRAVGLHNVQLSLVVYPRWRRRSRSQLTFFTPAPYDPQFVVLAGSAATAAPGLEANLVDLGGGTETDYLLRVGRGLKGTVHLITQRSESRRELVRRAMRYGAAAVILAHGKPSPKGKAIIENGTAVLLGRVPALAVSNETARYLQGKLARGPVRALLHINVGYGPSYTFNVSGEIPGQRSEYVVLAAHHDAWYAGAADNAAGVACLLELARVWRESRLRPYRTVRFVSYAAEEDGLMGSLFDVITRAALVKARCRGVVTPDVVGVAGGMLRFGGYPSQLVQAAADLAQDLGYNEATGYAIATQGAPVYGDHWPYAQLHLPALLVSKGPDPFYHTPYDLPDRLDYEDLRWTASIAGAMALRLAQR